MIHGPEPNILMFRRKLPQKTKPPPQQHGKTKTKQTVHG